VACVLTDTELKALIQTIREIAIPIDHFRDDILSSLEELQERRKSPNMPDAEELLAIEEQDQEARDDALGLDNGKPECNRCHGTGLEMDNLTPCEACLGDGHEWWR